MYFCFFTQFIMPSAIPHLIDPQTMTIIKSKVWPPSIDWDKFALENDRKSRAKIGKVRTDKFNLGRLFSKNRQLAKSFIDVYGTQGSIENSLPKLNLSLKTAMENEIPCWSNDLSYELQFQYDNMTRK